jgi:hypothetical protein
MQRWDKKVVVDQKVADDIRYTLYAVPVQPKVGKPFWAYYITRTHAIRGTVFSPRPFMRADTAVDHFNAL